MSKQTQVAAFSPHMLAPIAFASGSEPSCNHVTLVLSKPMYERQPIWDPGILATRERELASHQLELQETADQHRKAELERCIRTIEAMLPVYRQMERLMSAISHRIRPSKDA